MNTDRNSLTKAFIQSLNIRVTLRKSVAEIKRILSKPLRSLRLRVRHNVSSVSVFLSLFFLLFLQQVSASIQPEQIDLGALPVGKATDFHLALPFSGGPQLLTGVESSCSCLVVNEFPETMEHGDSYLNITFTPNEAGLSEVELTIYGLDEESGQLMSNHISVAVVGVEATEPAQLQSWIQPISPKMLHSNLEQYAIIDIRGAGSYEKAHIPGSFEYTLDAFVVLRQQFKKPLVLVGDGLLSAHERLLLEKGGEIKDRPMFWLQGGLPAWIRSGLPVQGKWSSPVDVSTISLQRWLETGGVSSGWEIIDLTGQAQSQSMFFGLPVHLYNSDSESDPGYFWLKVQEAALRDPDTRGLLVVGDARGLAYTGIEHHNAITHTVPVYYLNQGSAAVSGWLATARDVYDSGTKSYVYSSGDSLFSAPINRATLQTRRRSGCRSCPKR